MDFHIELSNKQILKGIIQSPGDNGRAVIVFVHGLGEHIQRYTHWAEKFSKERIGFVGMDLPGHGRSQGKRGHMKSYLLADEMIDILVNTSKKTFPGIPVYIYGHSLGGGIVLEYLLKKNPSVKGAIVTSPWLKLAFEPSKGKVRLASAMKAIYPGLIQPSGLNVNDLSHDVSVVEKYKNDPLVHDKISVGLFASAMSAASYSLENASSLKVKTLLMHGSDDHICSPDGSREFAAKTNKVELKIWEGGFHELHNEPFNDEVFTYIMGWINK